MTLDQRNCIILGSRLKMKSLTELKTQDIFFFFYLSLKATYGQTFGNLVYILNRTTGMTSLNKH